MSNSYAIEIHQLSKIFTPNIKAVDGLDLTVNEGEIMALLGPNGAGKSTTIRVLSTLSGFDSGKALVGELDVDTEPEKVRQTIGVVAQQTGVDYFLTGRENMMLQGHLYRMKKADIQQRIEELAGHFELQNSLDKMVSAYSGGMTRKLDIATALIHRPKILFLDEPTLGLDIRSRKMLWKLIEELNQNFGLTILLTTHYLEEADSLSDRVAIINAGKIQIIGTPDELKTGIHGDSVVISFDSVGKNEKALATQLQKLQIAREHVWDGNNLHLYVKDGATSVPQIMEQTTQLQLQVKTLSLARPTLDDVFLKYTGSSMLDSGEEETEEWWHKWAGKGGGGNWKKWAGSESSEEEADWGGNEWVDNTGKPKGEWEESAEWEGNEWVDAKGKAKPAGPAAKKQANANATAQQDAADQSPSTEKDWEGNEWVSKEGKQQGDWGDSPDWQGNEWVNAEGKPKEDWVDTEKQGDTDATARQDSTDQPSSAENNWEGNEWVSKEGKQQGDWGDSSDWQGNEWVNAEGKPKEDWSGTKKKKTQK